MSKLAPELAVSRDYIRSYMTGKTSYKRKWNKQIVGT